MQAYHQSASTLNLVRAFTKGGFADLNRVHAWTQEFVASSPEGRQYEQIANEIDRALKFMRACGVDTENNHDLSEVDVYTSHEALLLGYEEALTRQDSLTGGWYDCSAHMLWIGERTRQLDGAHVEFLRGVGNPIGCKIGPHHVADFVLELCDAAEPVAHPRSADADQPHGRRQGRGRRCRPSCARSATRATRSCGRATRCTATRSRRSPATRPADFTDICAEIDGFVRAHHSEGTWPGGIHIELTGDNVTECIGGADNILDSQLDRSLRDGVRPAAERPPEPRPRVPRRRVAALERAGLSDLRDPPSAARRCDRSTSPRRGRSNTSASRRCAIARRRRRRAAIDTVGDPDRRYRLASIAKPITAWAMLIAVEEGLAAARHARRPAGLHAAPPAGSCRRVRASTATEPISPPGRRRIYSNTGIEMAAEAVADAAGMPFAEYLTEAVLAAARRCRRPRCAARRRTAC